MSDHATVNINASMTQALGAINSNYQSVVGVVATLMALSAMESQQQAQLGTLFSEIEHDSDDDFKNKYLNNPQTNPYKWTNSIFELNNDVGTGDGSSTKATQFSSTFSSDQGTYNSVNQSYSGFISQINQMTSQNTQAEGQTTQIGSNIANFENGVSRLLTY